MVLSSLIWNPNKFSKAFSDPHPSLQPLSDGLKNSPGIAFEALASLLWNSGTIVVPGDKLYLHEEFF